MFKLLAGMTVLTMTFSHNSAASGNHPIELHVAPRAETLGIQVIGKSSMRYEATFLLEVEGGGNQSRHRGSAVLQPGEGVILSNLTLGLAQEAPWQARLRVEPRDGQPYEQVRTSR